MLQNLALADLKKVAMLGAGAFGQVTLVRHSSRYFALKTISKAQVVASGLQVCLHPLHAHPLLAACPACCNSVCPGCKLCLPKLQEVVAEHEQFG